MTVRSLSDICQGNRRLCARFQKRSHRPPIVRIPARFHVFDTCLGNFRVIQLQPGLVFSHRIQRDRNAREMPFGPIFFARTPCKHDFISFDALQHLAMQQPAERRKVSPLFFAYARRIPRHFSMLSRIRDQFEENVGRRFERKLLSKISRLHARALVPLQYPAINAEKQEFPQHDNSMSCARRKGRGDVWWSSEGAYSVLLQTRCRETQNAFLPSLRSEVFTRIKASARKRCHRVGMPTNFGRSTV